MLNPSNSNECIFDGCTLFDSTDECKAHTELSCIYLPAGCRTTNDCSSYNGEYLDLCDHVPKCAIYKGIFY